MKMNYKHLGLYVLAGIISAGFCEYGSGGSSGAYGLDSNFVFSMHPIWLAIAILVIGDYASGMRCRSDWLSPLVFIAMCEIGWLSAFYSFIFIMGWVPGNTPDYSWLSVIGSGLSGGICVAIGLVLTWKINKIRIVITTITLAGLLGALILLLDMSLEHLQYLSDSYGIVWWGCWG
jgi:hypothetical protein